MSDTYVETRRLQKWANDNEPKDTMLYKRGYWDQIIFMRDRVASMLARSQEEYGDFWDVSGTHTAKSIVLPVYKAVIDDRITIQARCNFHDWNVSILSSIPITPSEWLGLIKDDNKYGLFFQGMDMQYSPYNRATNNQKFSFCVYDTYEMYTFGLILRSYLGIKR